MIRYLKSLQAKTFIRIGILFLMTSACLSSVKSFATVKDSPAVVFESSNLAIVIINTNGRLISSGTRIIASMGIINNSMGVRNYSSDPYNDYDGRIEIEIRGHSSSGFDQQSYRIETQDSAGNNNNVPLLGMPKDNDWVLYGPYCDKSLIRNALVYQLAGEINAYAPRTRFCELLLNGSYQGVYLLTEKIKQGKNRVNIAKMDTSDLNEPEVSGGYMFKKELSNDKGDNVITLNSGLQLSIIEPKPEEIETGQTSWLKSHLDEFEGSLYNNIGDYSTYIDVQSMTDNFLMVELFKNVDGFRASTYFYKDRNARIVAGPVWDYNLSLGNADYNYGWTAERWYHEDENYWSFFWFDELISRASFWAQVRERWAVLRKNSIDYEHINSLIDSLVLKLEEAQERHFTRWDILGRYTWPNPGFPESGEWGFPAPTTGGPTTWKGEIDYVRDFVRDRISWMDIRLDYQPNTVYPVLSSVPGLIRAYPNPCSSVTNISYTLGQPGKVILKLYNISGKEIMTLENGFQPSGEFKHTIDTQNFQKGVYIIKLMTGDRNETLKLLCQ